MATSACACGHPSRLAEDGEHLRMTVVSVRGSSARVLTVAVHGQDNQLPVFRRPKVTGGPEAGAIRLGSIGLGCSSASLCWMRLSYFCRGSSSTASAFCQASTRTGSALTGSAVRDSATPKIFRRKPGLVIAKITNTRSKKLKIDGGGRLASFGSRMNDPWTPGVLALEGLYQRP
jgi:hypothetical protein